MTGSRSSRSAARHAPTRSRPKPESKAPDVELDVVDPDAPIVASLEELRASARRTSREAFLQAAPFIDAPARRGGIAWNDDDDEGAIPDRIPEDESPLDLSRRTWLRRERARRATTASASPSAGLASLMAEVKRREAEWRRPSA